MTWQPNTEANLDLHQKVFWRAKDMIRLMLDSNQSLLTEITALAAVFAVSKKQYFLQEKKLVLEKTCLDLYFALSISCPSLHRFVDLKNLDFDWQNTEDIIQELHNTWSKIKDVIEFRLMHLCEALLVTELQLEFCLLRAFISEEVYHVNKWTIENHVRKIHSLKITIQHILSKTFLAVLISTDNQHALLRVIMKKLREILDAGNIFNKNLKSCASNMFIDMLLQDI